MDSADDKEKSGAASAANKARPGKKELRNADTILKQLVGNLPAEERLQALVVKYAEQLEEKKTLEANAKGLERRLAVVQREREQLQAENGKGVLARSRLEELCRELQRQNKQVKEESQRKVREEEERRKEVAGKFQGTLSEVSALLQQNNEKNNKLRDENAEMARRLQTLCDQYALREQHLEKLAKQYDIERQLNEAKLTKERVDHADEKEKMLREKQQLLLDLTEYQKKCQGMQAEEMALRHQLSMYTDKYDDFQKALAQSNRTFGGFKEQMDAMTKKLKNLEKETQTWKQRWEKSNKALMDMAGEKQSRDASLAAATKQVAQLEKLCRALQTERQTLIAQLKQKSENTQPEETLSADSTATELESADETVEVAAAAPESATQEPVAAGEATPEADPSSTVSESAAETVEEPVPVVESTVQPLKADVDSAETCAEASPVPPSTAAAAESIVPTVETAAEEAEPTGESAESSSPVAESVPEPAAEAGEGRPAEEGEQPAASLNLDQAEASSQ